jgi:Flp pilus assembly protein TadB
MKKRMDAFCQWFYNLPDLVCQILSALYAFYIGMLHAFGGVFIVATILYALVGETKAKRLLQRFPGTFPFLATIVGLLTLGTGVMLLKREEHQREMQDDLKYQTIRRVA